MSNVFPPPLRFDTWRCPKCGHEEEIPRQRPLGGPINIGGGVFGSLFGGKEEHKCPKCGSKMKRK